MRRAPGYYIPPLFHHQSNNNNNKKPGTFWLSKAVRLFPQHLDQIFAFSRIWERERLVANLNAPAPPGIPFIHIYPFGRHFYPKRLASAAESHPNAELLLELTVIQELQD